MSTMEIDWKKQFEHCSRPPPPHRHGQICLEFSPRCLRRYAKATELTLGLRMKSLRDCHFALKGRLASADLKFLQQLNSAYSLLRHSTEEPVRNRTAALLAPMRGEVVDREALGAAPVTDDDSVEPTGLPEGVEPVCDNAASVPNWSPQDLCDDRKLRPERSQAVHSEAATAQGTSSYEWRPGMLQHDRQRAPLRNVDDTAHVQGQPDEQGETAAAGSSSDPPNERVDSPSRQIVMLADNQLQSLRSVRREVGSLRNEAVKASTRSKARSVRSQPPSASKHETRSLRARCRRRQKRPKPPSLS